jgi:hypothetical protein
MNISDCLRKCHIPSTGGPLLEQNSIDEFGAQNLPGIDLAEVHIIDQSHEL